MLFDPVNLIFLAAAVLLFLKLRASLGRRTGNEPVYRDVEPPSQRPAAEAYRPASISQAPKESSRPIWSGVADEGSSFARALEEIADADSSFDLDAFMEGARQAYETVSAAFAEDDRATLARLLDEATLKQFSDALDERRRQGRRMESSFVGLRSSAPADAWLDGRDAFIAVEFRGRFERAVLDIDSGEVVEGSPDKVVESADRWTFRRSIDSDDPNWVLVATETCD